MAMTFPYCNLDDDLQSVYKDIERFKGLDTLSTWTLTSGQSSTYEKRNTGHYGAVYQNGNLLTEKTSIATVEATASTWWYDATNDILYVHMDDGADPDTADTVTAHSVDSWANYKQECANRAFQDLEAMVDRKYPRPLPFARESYESANYDSHIITCAALLTCSYIIKGRDVNHPDWEDLYKQVWNDTEGETKGIMNRYADGEWSFSFETTQDEFNGNIRQLEKDSSSTGYVTLAGKGDQTSFERIKLLITTGGAKGTFKWKWSRDGGASYSDIITSKGYMQYYHLYNGIYVRFEGTFIANDEWQIDMAGDEHITNPAISSATLRLNK